jgi:hypothetical protein
MGTLRGILNEVAEHHHMTISQLVDLLFSK